MKRPYEQRLTNRVVVNVLLLMVSAVACSMAIGAAYVIVSLASGG